MNRSLLFKLGAIGFLIILFLIPLMHIDGLITERQRSRDAVVQDIARSSSYSQTLIGPILIVPYHKTEQTWREDATTHHRTVEEHEVSGDLYFLPETFNLNGQLKTEERARGIYTARLYHSINDITGEFSIPEKLGITDDYSAYRFDTAFIAVGINDIRGIEDTVALKLNNKDVKFEPGTKVKILGSGVHAPLPAFNPQSASMVSYQLHLKLQGTTDYQITPVGRTSKIALKSDWPNPSFVGEYLPSTRTINASGFSAEWNSTFFSTNMPEALSECVRSSNCTEFSGRHFGVSLIDPVDQYLKSERAIKYALLFIALTFAGFFLFEVLKSLAVHPIQYGLVGMALALFYLLLLSLSEHISFALAYGTSAVACVALIGFYVMHILKSVLRGMGFASSLGALYAVLYVLLNAEDYALLMGSILVFGLLSVVMVLTRNINWFSITQKQPT